VWESNPPFPLLAGNTGFEGREGHQNPMHSQWCYLLMIQDYQPSIQATGKIPQEDSGQAGMTGKRQKNKLMRQP